MKPKVSKMTCSDIEDWIEQGGDANAVQRYRQPVYNCFTTRSLLERAIELGCGSTVRLLIDKGATLHSKPLKDFYFDVPALEIYDRERLIPLCVDYEDMMDGNCLLFLRSLFFRNIEVSQILYERFVAIQNASRQREIIAAAMTLVSEIKDIEVLHFLLNRGGDKLINTAIFGFTPFHTICMCCDVEMVRILLEKGADPDLGNLDVGYPLLDAIHNRQEEVALLLIEWGADLNIQAKDRAKPLSLAKRRKLKRVVAAIEAKMGADPKS
jgi:hypothetical protein